MSDEPAPSIGHNTGGIAADRLRSIIERHERLSEEVKALRSDQRDILLEAKSAGFDVRALRNVIRIRARDPKDVADEQALTDLYMHALGD